MSFTPKAWANLPTTTTPVNAAALVDMETRLSAYTDTHANNTLLHPQQLGYAEITSDFTTTSTSLVDVTGLALAGIVIGARPVRVWFGWEAITSTVNGDVIEIQVLRGSTIIGSCVQVAGQSAGSGCIPFHDNPAAGTYTYKVQIKRFSGSGTVKIGAVVITGYVAPASLRVEEVAA